MLGRINEDMLWSGQSSDPSRPDAKDTGEWLHMF